LTGHSPQNPVNLGQLTVDLFAAGMPPSLRHRDPNDQTVTS
jgi:hypothetical protein